MIYVCSNCCSKVEKKDEVCPHYHNGIGICVDPISESEEQESMNLCSGVRRGRKCAPYFELIEDNR